eukprot:gene4477-6328_t
MRSDIKHIVLDRVRATINLLRKLQLNATDGEVNSEISFLTKLRELQTIARQSFADELDPLEIVTPFIQILRAKSISGPFKLAALDAIQTFICCNTLIDSDVNSMAALTEIIDAVTKCKFVLTDVVGDELVQLQLVHTLLLIVTHKIRSYLTDDSAWSIIENCFTILFGTGVNINKSISLYQEAEKTVIKTIEYVLKCLVSHRKFNTDTTSKSNDNVDITSLEESSSPIDSLTSNSPHLEACMCKIMEYFIERLKNHSSDAWQQQNLSKGKSSNNSNSLSRPISTQSFLGDMLLDQETINIIFTLKTLHATLLSDGDGTTMRTVIIRSRKLAHILSDELGLHLLMLCAKRDSYPPIVLQLSLGIFATLYNSIGPYIRIMVECFIKQVYMKALVQLLDIFTSLMMQEDSKDDFTPTDVRQSPMKLSLNNNAAAGNIPSTNFKVEELEIILESLCDFLADVAFLPALFSSFDCDPTKADLVQPMIQYLSRAARIVLNSNYDEQNALYKEIKVLTVQAYEQVVRSFANRCHISEKYEENQQKELLKEFYQLESEKENHILDDNLSDTPLPIDLNNEAVDLSLPNERLLGPLNTKALFKGLRFTKKVLLDASDKFTEKPELGLKYLQAQGILPTPVTPDVVANFLRIAPGLPKENVGSYLGELGKEGQCYEASGKDFHKEVLLKYVESFELSGQSVLNCLRIFLSAFRLPGEAQQIDRILVAFSEYCHLNSIEGRNGVLQNPEVTYLLTFSIIMLNTDRHNPNIRADRKMTLEQFIRNNTNYGKDVNQTVPLTKEFLEEIYNSISEFPIRTERNELAATVTTEVWMDLQMQSRANQSKAILLSSASNQKFMKQLNLLHHNGHYDPPSNEKIIHSTLNTANIARELLTSSLGLSSIVDPYEISGEVFKLHWLFDEDMIECVWEELLLVGMSVFLSNYRVMCRVNDSQYDRNGVELSLVDKLAKIAQLERSRGFQLQLSNTFLLEMLKSANFYKMHFLVDSVVLLLAEFAAMLKGTFAENILSTLKLEMLPDIEDFGASFINPFSTQQSTPVVTNNNNNNIERIISQIEITRNDPKAFIFKQINFSSARFALITLLQVIQANHFNIKNWSVIFVCLGLLRDSTLLPEEMVSKGLDNHDLLPPNVRKDFEVELFRIDSSLVDELQRKPIIRKKTRKAPSLLSLQGLGEALFGPSTGNGEDEIKNDSTIIPSMNNNVTSTSNNDLFDEQLCHIFNLASSRWDGGYGCKAPYFLIQEDDIERVSIGYSAAERLILSSVLSRKRILEQDYEQSDSPRPPSSPTVHVKRVKGVSRAFAVEDLRKLIAQCNISQLIPDSRFMTEPNLMKFMVWLIKSSELRDFEDQNRSNSDINSYSVEIDLKNIGSNIDIFNNDSNNAELLEVDQHVKSKEALSKLYVQSQKSFCESNKPISASSVAWLEMIIVEVALRNRDRFGSFWPILKQHYLKTLIGSNVTLSYITERRVCGLLKIVARMISRDQHSAELLELLGKLFISNNNNQDSQLLISKKNNNVNIATISLDDHVEFRNSNLSDMDQNNFINNSESKGLVTMLSSQ